jgi:Ser/Thr protein kinase RdoA (MazF antagonist)
LKPGERYRFWKVASFRGGHSAYADLTAQEVAELKMFCRLEKLAQYRLVGCLIRDWLEAERAHFAALSPDGKPPAPPAGPEGRRKSAGIEDMSE